MFVDSSGWIISISIIGNNVAVGAIMMIVAILFTICAVTSVFLLKMVRAASHLFVAFVGQQLFLLNNLG